LGGEVHAPKFTSKIKKGGAGKKLSLKNKEKLTEGEESKGHPFEA